MDFNQARPLILSDGRTGSVNQSLGVAAMLGWPDPDVQLLEKKITSRFLRWLPIPLLYSNLPNIERAAARADIIIAAGHAPSRVLRHLKKLQPNLFIVALMRPSKPLQVYDAIAVPRHDNPKAAENLIQTLGNCNRITKDLLKQEADRWRKRLSHLRGFKLAVLVGGASKHAPFGPAEGKAMMEALTKQFKKQFGDEGSLLVSTSRRTGSPTETEIARVLEASGVPYTLWRPSGDDGRDNPYLAYLALADSVLITAESTSMVSEAASAGKPVLLWGEVAHTPKKFRSFYETLIKQGRAHWMSKELGFRQRPPATGLMDTVLVAGFVRARWLKRFGKAKA